MGELDRGLLTESVSTPVREQESFPGTLFRTPDGSTVLDFGQNLAGDVEFSLVHQIKSRIRKYSRVPGPARPLPGGTIRGHVAEVEMRR